MATVPAFAPVPGATSARGRAGFGAMPHRFGARREHARARRREVARITRESRACTARELTEPGLSRAGLPAVAHGTFRAG